MGAGVFTTISEASSALDTLGADDLRDLSYCELHDVFRAVDRLKQQALAFEVNTLAEIDGRGSYELEGAKSAAAYAAWQTPITQSDAKLLVLAGRALLSMPLVAEAFHAGTVTVGQLQMLARCQAINPEAFERDEALLLGHVGTFDMRDLALIYKHWQRCADPDGSFKDAEQCVASRKATIRQRADGMTEFNFVLDPINAEIFENTLRSIERELFDADWAVAIETHGEDTCVNDLERRPEARLADAAVLMASRAGMVTPGAEDHGPRPLLTVVCGEPTLSGLCETEGGRHLDPHEIIRLLTRADIERVVFDGPSRIVDVGVRQRLFTGATRRAVEVRDRECDHPSCHEPVTRADIHHIVEYADGGETIQTNGLVYCKWHHRWHHRQPPPAA